MIVVPCEPDGVLADRFSGKWFSRGLEHGQHAESQFGRLTGLAAGLFALFVTHGAGAGIAQINESVVRNVAIFPFNVHSSADGEVYLH